MLWCLMRDCVCGLKFATAEAGVGPSESIANYKVLGEMTPPGPSGI